MDTNKGTGKNKRYFHDTGENEENKNEMEVFHVKMKPLSKHHIQKLNYNNNTKKIKVEKNKALTGKAPIDKKKLEKHSRGEGFEGKGVKHPLYALKLKKKENKYKYAQEQAARAEILLTENAGYLEVDEGHRTTSITQSMIAENVDITAATKIFDLNLDFGPYRAKYSKNGRHLLLGSSKGHLAAFDWVTKRLHCEINVMESIHDISWLHVETMLAAAQKEWLYIYDNTGTEIHCIKKMDKILRMEFLPYHFLLAAVNEFGFMTWLDISIGEIVGHYNNQLGRTAVMTQNPYNATICLGNSKGVVSLWSPMVKKPLAKILCHKTPLTAIAVDKRGSYMATTGVDKSLKIWDIRNLDGPLQHYKLMSPAVDLDFSQKDMLAVGLGDIVEIYDNCCTQTTDKAYMRHKMARTISNFKFCPYEDVLGIGTSKGFTSIIVPGSGEPNFDAYESNPYQTKTQRKEAEVKALLEKIPAELITLNPFEVVEVDVPTMKDKIEAKSKLLHVKNKKIDIKPRHKKKGITDIARKKIIKEVARKELINQAIEVKKMLNEPEKQEAPKQSFGVLDRFVSKTKSKK
ncbi:WD repeat-containing protein 46 [Colias croceus]|uniref:WD repeat-containing protein 46 n=1 Tax=Colias crocea TaxID=72248 RepID=UPI001E27C476|nr:WD repeat-containing protein 46 [Colias croceus]